jgi:DNA-binding NarL/FixJ family response regulator
VRVGIADDGALWRAGLASLLTEAGKVVTTLAPDGAQLLRAVAWDPPDAVIIDIRMPPTFTDEGITTAIELSRRFPAISVLVLSTFADASYAERLLSARRSGIGYLLKDRLDDIKALTAALDRICSGECVVDPGLVRRLMGRPGHRDVLALLTDREKDVLRLMAEGRSNIGICQELHLSAKTVETHISAVFTKLGLESVTVDNRRVIAVLTWLRARQ